MKKIIYAFVFFMFLSLLPTSELLAQVVVSVRPARPATVVVKPAKVRRGHIWVAGHWKYNTKRNRYVWVDARWIKAKRGHQYVAGRWINVKGGYKWVPGHWSRA